MNTKPDRSVISMFVGQCGIQTGAKIWELLAYEHDINPDGTRNWEGEQYGNINSFFIETLGCKYVPKALMFDTDNNIINEIQYLPHSALFNDNYFACGSEDACGVFTVAKEQIETYLRPKYEKALRSVMEQCDLTCGALTFSAIGGGTGSAGALLAQQYFKLMEKKAPVVWCTLLPNQTVSNSPVESLNTGYALKDELHGQIDLQIMYDNQALYSLAKQCMTCPVNYSHLNMLIARMTSCISASMRLPSELNVDLRDLVVSLVPRNPFKFVFPTFAPSQCNNTNYRLAVSDIVSEVFQPDCSMLSQTKLSNPPQQAHRYITMAMLFRGDVQPQTVYKSVNDIVAKNSYQFVDYLPCNYTIGINTDLLLTPDSWPVEDPCRGCCAITHHTRVVDNFQMIFEKMNSLLMKDAYQWNFDPYERNMTSDSLTALEDLMNQYMDAFASES